MEKGEKEEAKDIKKRKTLVHNNLKKEEMRNSCFCTLTSLIWFSKRLYEHFFIEFFFSLIFFCIFLFFKFLRIWKCCFYFVFISVGFEEDFVFICHPFSWKFFSWISFGGCFVICDDCGGDKAGGGMAFEFKWRTLSINSNWDRSFDAKNDPSSCFKNFGSKFTIFSLPSRLEVSKFSFSSQISFKIDSLTPSRGFFNDLFLIHSKESIGNSFSNIPQSQHRKNLLNFPCLEIFLRLFFQ